MNPERSSWRERLTAQLTEHLGGEIAGDDLAKAVALAGLIAAYAPDESFDAAVAVLASVAREHVELDPLIWADPVGLDPAILKEIATWTYHWDELLPWPVRLEITPAEDGPDPMWLTEVMVPADVITPFVPLHHNGRWASWRLPYRIGFLDTPDGNALRAQVAEAIAGARMSLPVQPVSIGHAHVACDILVVDEDPHDAVRSVRRPHEVRADAILVTRGLDVWDGALVRDLAAGTGAWAVGFGDLEDLGDGIARLAGGLARDLTLDMAFLRVASGRRVFAAVPEVATRARSTRRARAVARVMETLGQPVLNRVGTPRLDPAYLTRVEALAANRLELVTATRRLQARLSTAEHPDVPLDRFQPGAEHRIDVRVGHGVEDWPRRLEALPEDDLPLAGPHLLTVVLTEPHLLTEPAIAEIELPTTNDSTTATFTLATRPDTTAVDARIIVLHRNRVLQTARLPEGVGTDGDSPVHPNVAMSETLVAPPITALGDRRTFDAAFVVNHGPDDVGRVTHICPSGAGIVTLEDDGLKGVVNDIKEQLGEIVADPNVFKDIGTAGSVKLLISLAYRGLMLYNALMVKSAGKAEALARARYVQVVSAKENAFFPFELAYEFELPDEDATLCPSAVKALESDDLDAHCPGQHATGEFVCPFGFWGLTKVIERHAYQPWRPGGSGFLLSSCPTRDRDHIELGSVVLAASNRVDKVEGSITAMTKAISTVAGRSRTVTMWTDWEDAMLSESPGLLMLLAHTVYSPIYRGYGLEIGDDARRWSANINKSFVPPNGRPVIVALLGCETALAGEVGYELFPSLLRTAAEAEIVIATLTEILGRHAAPLAARLVEELYRACAEQPLSVGEVLVRLRRRLLRDGLLPVLALAIYGDAEWLLAKES